MGATIDPVTGMPNISGPEIDQIALGTQTFPWDDLKADGRPTRPAAYSDDLIPTTSIIVGQREADRNQVKIPTVTDDRRLRVDAAITSGGGGGGSSPFVPTSPPVVQSLLLVSPTLADPGLDLFGSSDPMRIFTYCVMPSTTGGVTHDVGVYFEIFDPVTDAEWILATACVRSIAGSTALLPMAAGTLVFDNGLDWASANVTAATGIVRAVALFGQANVAYSFLCGK